MILMLLQVAKHATGLSVVDGILTSRLAGTPHLLASECSTGPSRWHSWAIEQGLGVPDPPWSSHHRGGAQGRGTCH